MVPEIKNLKRAAQRIKRAIKNKESIILYGDADLDGTTSVVLLKETIESLGGEAALVYFPDREEEGYGLSAKALKFFGKYAPALLITLDCGIGNFKSLEKARDLGFNTIVVDHHQILEKLPPADIIVDPEQKGDNYPFKKMANVGLCFKLCSEIFGKNFSPLLANNFLELVALGTIADKMPEIDDNKVFIEKGLNSIPSTFRVGLRVMFDAVRTPMLSTREVVSAIVSALNITPIKRHLTGSYRLLCESSEKKAEALSQSFLELSQERRSEISELTFEVTEKVSSQNTIVFQGGSDFPLVLAGAVASRICGKFQKPTFIFKKKKNISIGSVRVPHNIDSIKALEHCASLLEVYGGHAPASGFTVKNKNLEELRECLENYFQNLK
ncbi:DHH family phosphoesterase [bacterium]|nr:DHH family phosphoesterase [bacterium]